MTIVFVHGVPETPSVWNPLRELIQEPTVALRLPGFGSVRPAGLRDKEGYAAWLAERLRELDGPIDLVGHDWGAHLTMRVVSHYDVEVRSWVSDVAHGWHPDYRWHEAATLWQSSPEGEESLASLRRTTPDDGFTFGRLFRDRGLSEELGNEIDSVHDEEMSAAILSLYRSAWPNFAADWGKDFDGPAKARGLLLAPTGDPMGLPDLDRDMATRLGAELHELTGLTHYWMLQDPERGARVLREFWASLDD
ncbi:alpha/beta fold hydrolase [Actinoalloteichus hymeniacidonis]|jgi:pimeloyl-ACP methyl ester carboxylesterase|uniref:Hydrolase or acyltransferase of alpha/beta superfamily n=1 Tax=Actinoalloteichus hymeniacidonis TaxID=340345 RepID=A0AAC9MZM0_9PSEU|nr:alpha/beta hydrolase [Actinoalloteichus hymeniacidonis]AOS64515.1 putative hydrolase or acyltransferase of alpha/beta superfamily [Actinoalloteichus hymeniacidonis]MBB5907413.1 pimeloyl-ACP methyl ester carboxylesterase [Actinoalloteichus hymeniacidonis]